MKVASETYNANSQYNFQDSILVANIELSQPNPVYEKQAIFLFLACTRSMCFLSANTQRHCPRTACPWYPHMICHHVLSPGCFSTHAFLTRIHAHQTHGVVTRATAHERARRQHATAPAQAVQFCRSARRGDASHTLTTLRTGKASKIQYRLSSSVRFSHNCFFQIHIDLRQLPLCLVICLLNFQRCAKVCQPRVTGSPPTGSDRSLRAGRERRKGGGSIFAPPSLMKN